MTGVKAVSLVGVALRRARPQDGAEARMQWNRDVHAIAKVVNEIDRSMTWRLFVEWCGAPLELGDSE